jgi:hypothetical protein
MYIKANDGQTEEQQLNAAIVSSTSTKAIIWDPIGTGCMACCSGNPEPVGGVLFSVVE